MSITDRTNPIFDFTKQEAKAINHRFMVLGDGTWRKTPESLVQYYIDVANRYIKIKGRDLDICLTDWGKARMKSQISDYIEVLPYFGYWYAGPSLRLLVDVLMDDPDAIGTVESEA